MGESRLNQATTLTVDNVFSTFPDLLGVFTSSKTNEIESDLFGWYLAYLRKKKQHHLSLTCLPDRCMCSTNYDKKIQAEEFDFMTGGTEMMDRHMKTRLSYLTLKKAVALKARNLVSIFEEISLDEYLYGVYV